MTDPYVSPEGDVIVKSTIPIVLTAHTKAATVAPRMCVQSAGDGNSDDLLEIIFGASESKRITGWALYDFANKVTLSRNNATISKASTFAIADGVNIGMRIPVVEAILTTGQGTCLPGQRYVCAGNGYLKTHPDSLATAVTTAATTYYLNSSSLGIPLDPTIAIGLSRVTTVDATQVIQVMPLW